MYGRGSSPDLDHGQAGLDEAADVLPDLPVGLGRLPEVVPHLLVGLVHHALLLAGRTPRRAAPAGGAEAVSTHSAKATSFMERSPHTRLKVLHTETSSYNK